ncbi:MAG: WYL domain-containing protein [Clostridiales bacterium]|nr:WYL domain-containing protein [Clostridiales bacterium]
MNEEHTVDEEHTEKNMSQKDNHPSNALWNEKKKRRTSSLSLFPERTLRTKVNQILDMYSTDDALAKNARSLLEAMMGGSIKSIDVAAFRSYRKNKKSSSQKRFYFSPILTGSDLKLVCGTIQSNSYLSSEEKEYLLSRIRLLNPICDFTKDDFKKAREGKINLLEKLPTTLSCLQQSSLPTGSHRLLSHISTIYEAIQHKYQITVIYGTYNKHPHSSHLTFHAKNENAPYILNPYALFCYRGQYYLLASTHKYPTPTHFRIDRMIDVRFREEKTEDGLLEYMTYTEIPELLKPYYKKRNGCDEFDHQKYVAAHPGMRIFKNERTIDCCFECTTWSLQILVDTFGQALEIHESPIPHSADELDYNGREQIYLKVTVKGVQYENAHKFCIEQHEYLTLLSPAELVEDVCTTLQESLNRYKKYKAISQCPEIKADSSRS